MTNRGKEAFLISSQLMHIAQDISSWEELESAIRALPTEQDRGEAFEQFCHAYFVLDPIFQFKEVYRHNNIPHSIREQLGYTHTQDIGIDGVAMTDEGSLFAYQAKFRSDRRITPTLRELSTFFTVSDRADWRITITNANKLPKSINDRLKQSQILADKFDQLDESFFRRLAQYLETQTIPPLQKRSPHQTQQEAIDAALSHFTANNRGQLILPCGTGKTLAALWIAEKLGGSSILIMVPSLALMRQTLQEWAANTSIKPFRYLCLCSDPTVDLEKQDSFVTRLNEMEVPVTTDVETVVAFLKKETSKPSVLLSTYQSGRVLSEAALASGNTFDFAIFDEAHRTTGTKTGVWNLAVDDANVPARLRLFMTATPRIYAPHVTKKAKEKDILICSMDDEKLYGKPFYEMTFGEAIQRGHITDYKVVVICVTDNEVQSLIQKRGTILADEQEWDANALAKRVAIVKGIHEYGLKKVFTFHSRVAGAKTFTSTDASYGIHSVFDMISKSMLSDKVSRFLHVNGGMPTGVRSEIMKEFKKADLAIMSNAHCLTEGVDVPAVDTVAFIDPKQSLVDIVQASGRALRRFDEGSKHYGYIFIPVVITEEADVDVCLESSDFKTVWNVLQAMSDQDQRLQDIVSRVRVLEGKGEKDSVDWQQAMDEYSGKIDILNIPIGLSKSEFVNALRVKSIDITGNSWDFWYGLTLAYMRENNGNANAPASCVTSDGFNLGHWQANQKQAYKKGVLSSKRVEKLESIGFAWQQRIRRNNAWDDGFEETLKYKEQNDGNPNASISYVTYNGFKLGIWQRNKRIACEKGTLSSDSIEQLEGIGFIWQRREPNNNASWEDHFQETITYKEQNDGNPNAPQRYITSDGFKLGIWQDSQRCNYRKNNLTPDRIAMLDSIGFEWHLRDMTGKRGFQETLKYMRQHDGNPNAPEKYVTADGFKLGCWQHKQKQQYRKGALPQDRIEKLEKIGFVWCCEHYNAWDDGFEETLKYKEQNDGNPNASISYVTSNGFKLGQWQSRARSKYNNGLLSPDCITRLQNIGFVWNKQHIAWEKGFYETIKFKLMYSGNCNAPVRYLCVDGFKLGSWQAVQRRSYRMGLLHANRVERLDGVGFIWDLWEIGFQETIKYKELNAGDPNAPTGYETPEGYSLYEWQKRQIQYHIIGRRLSHDKVQRLESIGFKWKLKNDPPTKQ